MSCLWHYVLDYVSIRKQNISRFEIWFLRMIEMGASSFPEIFHSKGMAQEVCKWSSNFAFSFNLFDAANLILAMCYLIHSYNRWLVGFLSCSQHHFPSSQRGSIHNKLYFFLTPWNGSIGLEAGKEYWLALISEETNPAECLIIMQLKSGRTLYFIVMVTTRMVNQIGVSVHQFGKN